MKIAMLDSREENRARLSHALSFHGVHVEPCESVGEWVEVADMSDLALVSDRNRQLNQALTEAGKIGRFLPVIAYRTLASASRIVDAIRAGAVDYLTDLRDPELVVERVRNASSNSNHAAVFKQRCMNSREKIKQLSTREEQVLLQLASGKTNKMIGRELNISPRTVEIHRSNMLGKLDVKCSAGAVRVALEAEFSETVSSPSLKLSA